MSGALLVSRYTECFPFFKTFFEELGYTDVHTTEKEKDALNMLINEINPRYVFVDSNFYCFATPCNGTVCTVISENIFCCSYLIKPFPRYFGDVVYFSWDKILYKTD